MIDITSKLRSALAESAFAGLAVVIAATDCTYAADEIDRLRAELAGYVEANRYMKGDLEDAIEDARKYCEARREIARLREALSVIAYPLNVGKVYHMDAVTQARAALAQVAEVGK